VLDYYPDMNMRIVLSGALALVLAGCGAAPAAPSVSAPAKPSGSLSTAPAASGGASAKPAVSGAAVSSSALGSPAASGLTKLTIIQGSLSGTQFPLWMAMDGGILRQHGIDVDLSLLTGANAITTLVAGQTQVVMAGGGEVLNAVANGADLDYAANISPRFDYVFLVAPEVKTVNDLKGKKVGVASTGGTIYMATRVAFKRMGIDYFKDVNAIQMGVTQERIAALDSGAIEATMADPPSAKTMEAKGFRVLYDMVAQGIPYAGSGIVFKKSWLTANHDLAQRYVDAIIQGIKLTKDNKDLAVATYKKYTKNDSQALAEDAWNYYTPILPALPHPNAGQFSEAIDILAEQNPKVKNVDLNAFVDDSFVKDAEARGLGK
jgi:NitT/TauT family transport system substrate-binding protein